MDPTTFARIRKLVHEASGIVLDEGKEYLVEARLAPLARDRGKASVDDLLRGVDGRNEELLDHVIDAMTTNETSFFRDPLVYDALRDEILPELIERRAKTRRLDVWSAASSSGQEAVSIAMLIREDFPQLDDWTVRILATDINVEMVERCSEGLYSKLEVGRGLKPELLARYFRPEGARYRTTDAIRGRIECRRMNLTRPFYGVGDIDLVLLRNVLIYFDEETKAGILRRVGEVLRPDGVLLLGTAETASAGGDRFTRTQLARTSCYRRAA